MKTLACLVIAIAALPAQLGAAGPIPTAPVYTNKARFRIPFHYDNAELKRLDAREIRLYVSRDRGRAWRQLQAVAPDAGRFNFQADTDGEYWFNVRTLDGRNQLHPDGPPVDPGLQVVVDTTPPRLKLDLRSPNPGKVILLWSSSDEHLDATQLRLEYTQPGTLEWKPVSVVPKAAGQTEWQVPQGGMVFVRGIVSDLAKNTASDQARLQVAATGPGVQRPRAPDLRQPIAGPVVTPREDIARTLPEDFPGGEPRAQIRPAPAPRTAADDVKFAPMRTARKVAGPAAHKHDNLASRTTPEAQSRPNEGSGKTPPSPRRVVGGRQFQIGYRLQEIDTSGVGAVELFVTEDDGKTWFRYGTDEDRKSPVQVEVPRDGTYGFTLSVTSAGGAASDVPRNGDPPTLYVVVDQTPPTIELSPLEQGRGRNADKLRISWQYADESPHDAPIALAWSASGRDAWQPICDWTQNTGSFVWELPSDMPARFFVRVEARDSVDNRKTSEISPPVLLDVARPTARILDVESNETAGPQN